MVFFIDREQKTCLRIIKFAQTTQGEAHFRKSLLVSPRLANRLDLLLRGLVKIGVRRPLCTDSFTLGMVEGSPHVLELLPLKFEISQVDNCFFSDLDR